VQPVTRNDLLEKILSGDEKSAARLISLIEEGREEGYEALSEIYPFTGKAHIIGITGPPGAGKSTLAGRLAVLFTESGKQVGVVAVDPSSVKRSGALLGDRVRMKDAEKLKSVFIRSMANRAHPGGLAKATSGAVYILEALGKDTIIVESVGAGQSEKALSYIADTIITVFTPDYGDEIQLLKAGLVEIGDIVVVNKSDNSGAERARQLLAMYVEQGEGAGWNIPVLLCRANKGAGVEEVAGVIGDHYAFLREGGEGVAKKREQRLQFTLMLVKEELMNRFLEANQGTQSYVRWSDSVRDGSVDPYKAVRQILDVITEA
jgi:LAO/AO transport system kinase